MITEFEIPPPEEPKEPQKPGCIFRAIIGFIILTLLASSLVSIAWFVQQRTGANTVAALPTPDQRPTIEPAAPTEDLTPSPTPPPTAPLSEENEGSNIQAAAPGINRIVLVTDDGQIETVAPDGSDRRILTTDDYFFQVPTWSPDGSQIAALANNREGSGIFLLEDSPGAGTADELLFGSGPNPFYLYWSPDSSQISFLASDIGSQMSLNIIDAGNQDIKLVATGSPFYWNWTADSDDLLIHSGAASTSARLTLIDNGGNDKIPEIKSPGYFQAPGISPSGNYWAYSQLQDGNNSWLVIDNRLDGTKQSERHAGSVALSWSPTEDKLAFISGDGDNLASFWGPLRLLDAETGEMHVLSSNFVIAFFWSPDGKKIATISVPFDFGLDGGVEVRSGKPLHLARRSSLGQMQIHPQTFSLSVINIEDGSGLELGEVSFANSFLAQFLVFFDQYALSHSIWSPASDALVLPILKNEQIDLTVISAKGGRMNSIGPGSIAFWSPN